MRDQGSEMFVGDGGNRRWQADSRRGGVLLCVLLAWACLVQTAPADVIYVKKDATGANDGTSWMHAYPELRDALAVAEWGDEIWVAGGTYKPSHIDDPAATFQLAAGVRVYGGFDGDELSLNERDWIANETILSGELGDPEEVNDNSYTVVTGAHGALMDGFTITKGNRQYEGGGAGMRNDAVSPTVRNCTFLENRSLGGGGGIENRQAAPIIEHCQFLNNFGILGGAICNYESTPTISDSLFIDNWGGDGGAIFATDSTVEVLRCIFLSNSTGSGGAICTGKGTCIAVNCLFVNNQANHLGGAIFNSSRLFIFGCTMTGNTSGSQGGGIYCDGDSSNLTNVILWNNSSLAGPEIYRKDNSPLIIQSSAIKGSGGSGTFWDGALGTDAGGNLTENPQFVDPDNPPGNDGEWLTSDDGLMLSSASPCIDAGSAQERLVQDIRGRIRDELPDMGAYEYSITTPGEDPPTQPTGRLALAYLIETPSTTTGGDAILYEYHWASDFGDEVTVGPTEGTFALMPQMELAEPGEIWTVTVTPIANGVRGTSTTAKVRLAGPESGVEVWRMLK